MVCEHIRTRGQHPVRIFIKVEPHTLSKAKEGRWRLISGVSLVEQIIDHMLWDHLLEKQNDNPLSTPIRAGWTWIKGGWRMVDPDACAYDMSSWDWTVPMWLIEDCWDLMKELTLTDDVVWNDIVDWRFDSLFRRCIFQLSDGSQVKQLNQGIVKSGTVVTLAANSLMQVLLHAVTAFQLGNKPPSFQVIGDDYSGEELSEEHLRYVSQWVTLKRGEDGEFCSNLFREGKVEPTRFGKHLFILACSKPVNRPDVCRCIQIVYARSSRLPAIRRIVSRICPGSLLSKSELKRIFDGE
jgi:hypothetical protein